MILSVIFAVEHSGHLNLVVLPNSDVDGPFYGIIVHTPFLQLCRLQMLYFPGKKTTAKFSVGSIVRNFMRFSSSFRSVCNSVRCRTKAPSARKIVDIYKLIISKRSSFSGVGARFRLGTKIIFTYLTFMTKLQFERNCRLRVRGVKRFIQHIYRQVVKPPTSSDVKA